MNNFKYNLEDEVALNCTIISLEKGGGVLNNVDVLKVVVETEENFEILELGNYQFLQVHPCLTKPRKEIGVKGIYVKNGGVDSILVRAFSCGTKEIEIFKVVNGYVEPIDDVEYLAMT